LSCKPLKENIREQPINWKNSAKKNLSPVPPAPRKTNIEIITESLRNCLEAKDSLSKKAKEFENVILDLERNCLKAGK
jgi:hypothetical protein